MKRLSGTHQPTFLEERKTMYRRLILRWVRWVSMLNKDETPTLTDYAMSSMLLLVSPLGIIFVPFYLLGMGMRALARDE